MGVAPNDFGSSHVVEFFRIEWLASKKVNISFKVIINAVSPDRLGHAFFSNINDDRHAKYNEIFNFS
jgi:hypothetical protein